MYICWWLYWGFVAAWAFFPLIVVSGTTIVAVCSFLIAVASIVVKHEKPQLLRVDSVVAAHGLSGCGSWAPEHRLSSCGTWAQLLCGRWDLPGSGVEPMSPTLAGGFFSTEPLGKPGSFNFYLKRNVKLNSLVDGFAFISLITISFCQFTRPGIIYSQFFCFFEPSFKCLYFSRLFLQCLSHLVCSSYIPPNFLFHLSTCLLDIMH